jgi:hypothetical protein
LTRKLVKSSRTHARRVKRASAAIVALVVKVDAVKAVATVVPVVMADAVKVVAIGAHAKTVQRVATMAGAIPTMFQLS